MVISSKTSTGDGSGSVFSTLMVLSSKTSIGGGSAIGGSRIATDAGTHVGEDMTSRGGKGFS